MSTPLIFVDGDQGTTGLQIHERLRGRVEQRDLKLLTLPADARKNAQRRAEAINACDVVILCLPDAAAREAIAAVVSPHVRMISASSAHRTTPGWVYGFPEMNDEQTQHVTGASRVTNPGCYPTGVIGLLRPLMQAGPMPADYPISVHAVSGYLGDGRTAMETHEGPETVNTLPFQVYGPGLAHKHTPEIQLRAGLTQRPMFVPACGAYRQGTVLTVPLELRRPNAGVNAAALYACLADHHTGTSHVDVMPLQAPSVLPHLDPQALNGTSDMRLGMLASDHGQILLTAVFDDLSKGTSSTAMQNLDLMLAQ